MRRPISQVNRENVSEGEENIELNSEAKLIELNERVTDVSLIENQVKKSFRSTSVPCFHSKFFFDYLSIERRSRCNSQDLEADGVNTKDCSVGSIRSNAKKVMKRMIHFGNTKIVAKNGREARFLNRRKFTSNEALNPLLLN